MDSFLIVLICVCVAHAQYFPSPSVIRPTIYRGRPSYVRPNPEVRPLPLSPAQDTFYNDDISPDSIDDLINTKGIQYSAPSRSPYSRPSAENPNLPVYPEPADVYRRPITQDRAAPVIYRRLVNEDVPLVYRRVVPDDDGADAYRLPLVRHQPQLYRQPEVVDGAKPRRRPDLEDDDSIIRRLEEPRLRRPAQVVALEATPDLEEEQEQQEEEAQESQTSELRASASGEGRQLDIDPSGSKGRLAFQIHGQKGPHSYRFGYDTGKGYNRQFRYEERDNYGNVQGRYGFYDKTGKLQVVNYSASPQGGFHAEGDFGKYPN